MEMSPLKIAVHEYLELLVIAGDLRVQADEATGLVTQLTKSKASPEKLKEARIKYNALRAQWEIAFEPAKIAYEKAAQLKADLLDHETDIPSYDFLAGKRRGKNDVRADRIAELRAQLVIPSLDASSGINGPSEASQKTADKTSGVNVVRPTTPTPASEAGVPDVPATSAQVAVATPASGDHAPPHYQLHYHPGRQDFVGFSGCRTTYPPRSFYHQNR
ncbi:hypothetical protein NP233_g11864 [Leucocoprinus birnbaumii]|uniref:Uncharacterized protein n=1 Tax=Leucocoprinus birnbaumii TaxID=56174 RepID=A0AAD5VGN4_9AGAR|nr:hypothetical protein NP233_g11864 [Leucocoprinus birnbaumii]